MKDQIMRFLHGHPPPGLLDPNQRSSNPRFSSPQPSVLSITSSPQDKTIIHIQPENSPPTTPPLYIAHAALANRPTVSLFCGSTNPSSIPVATAKIHSFTSTIDLLVHGQSITMRESQLSGKITINWAAAAGGFLVWKVNPITGSPRALYDGSGAQIATVGSSLGSLRLAFHVSGDGFFMDLVLVTVVVARLLSRAAMDGVSETVGALVG